jgi:hypothetical protein
MNFDSYPDDLPELNSFDNDINDAVLRYSFIRWYPEFKKQPHEATFLSILEYSETSRDIVKFQSWVQLALKRLKEEVEPEYYKNEISVLISICEDKDQNFVGEFYQMFCVFYLMYKSTRPLICEMKKPLCSNSLKELYFYIPPSGSPVRHNEYCLKLRCKKHRDFSINEEGDSKLEDYEDSESFLNTLKLYCLQEMKDKGKPGKIKSVNVDAQFPAEVCKLIELIRHSIPQNPCYQKLATCGVLGPTTLEKGYVILDVVQELPKVSLYYSCCILANVVSCINIIWPILHQCMPPTTCNRINCSTWHTRYQCQPVIIYTSTDT